jgi:hypothetical protein
MKQALLIIVICIVVILYLVFEHELQKGMIWESVEGVSVDVEIPRDDLNAASSTEGVDITIINIESDLSTTTATSSETDI